MTFVMHRPPTAYHFAWADVLIMTFVMDHQPAAKYYTVVRVPDSHLDLLGVHFCEFRTLEAALPARTGKQRWFEGTHLRAFDELREVTLFWLDQQPNEVPRFHPLSLMNVRMK